MSDNSITIPYQGAGTAAYDAASTVGKAVFSATKDITCPLYKNFPSFMSGELFNSPFSAEADSYLNDLCAPTGNLPTPRQPPFSGGQCLGVAYRVQASVSAANGQAFSVNAVFNGTIASAQIESGAPNQSGDPTVSFIIRGRNNSDGAPFVSNQVGPLAPGASASGIVVSREDGLPDTCGDPIPKYPIAQPPDIALNLTVPIQLTPTLVVNAPVTVFAPVDILAPSLKIGDFNIDFNLGGLTISPTININPTGTNPNGNKPPQPQPGQQPADRDQDKSNEILLRYLKRLRSCQECDLDYDFLSTASPEGSSGIISVPLNTIPVAVGLTVTGIPSNAKSQPGLGQPNVLYGGWAWFDGNDFLGVREPVDASKKIFFPHSHPSPTAFHFTMQAGYTAVAVLTYKRLKNPLPTI